MPRGAFPPGKIAWESPSLPQTRTEYEPMTRRRGLSYDSWSEKALLGNSHPPAQIHMCCLPPRHDSSHRGLRQTDNCATFGRQVAQLSRIHKRASINRLRHRKRQVRHFLWNWRTCPPTYKNCAKGLERVLSLLKGFPTKKNRLGKPLPFTNAYRIRTCDEAPRAFPRITV